MPSTQIAFYTHVNVTMQIMSCVVLSVLMVSLIVKKAKSKQECLFLMMVIIHSISTVSNVAAWLSAGRTEPVFRIINETGTFITFIVESVLVFFFLLYILSIVKAVKSKRILRLIGTLGGGLIIIVVMNLFSGFVYTHDENNMFIAGDYFWLPHIITITMCALSAVQIIRLRRFFDKYDAVKLITYPLVPVITLFIGIAEPHIELSYPAAAIALLLIYVGIQLEQEKRLARQNQELAESRAAVMLSQIQPHFLYNTLTTIETICYKDGETAARLVRDFSGYLRENMDSLTQKELVSFEREITHVKVYLEIEKLRFEERLKVIYDLEITDFKLPILTVQPLAENAVRHGVTKRARGGTVVIKTAETETDFLVIVTDDGVGFSTEQPKQDGRSHIGIENVRERLQSGCGGALTVESEIGKGTICTISIPKKERDKK